MTDQDQPFDMNALLQQAQQMSEQLVAAQQVAAAQVFQGQAGGGAVKVEVTGALEFRSVSIASGAVDPNDVEMLEDLVLAALNDAASQMGGEAGAELGGMDLAGVDMGELLGGGGLEGLLGGDPS